MTYKSTRTPSVKSPTASFTSQFCKLDIGRPPVDAGELKLVGVTLDSVEVVRDLGIYRDQHLSFQAHISEIVKKAYIRGNMILHYFKSRNRLFMVKAFFSPYMCARDCAAITRISLINNIENVQSTFTKRLPGLKHLTYAKLSINLKVLNSGI